MLLFPVFANNANLRADPFTMRQAILVVFLFCCSINLRADSLYVRKIVDTLCSRHFFGRGYVNDGMSKAASFIENEMKRIGLSVQQQSFEYPVNTFPGNMYLSVNDRMLRPGSDFLVSANSKGCQSSGALVQVDSNTFINRENKVLFQTSGKLTWTVAKDQLDYTTLQLSGTTSTPTSYECNITNLVNQHFKAGNIVGFIKGNVKADSLIIFTAHYDHLGGMGNQVFFPGANDNAAGVATMLDMAQWFMMHPPAYSMMFIAFAGEEAGLIGSKYFTEHPLIDLKKISFLINLDLVGTGDEGITVVNATEYPGAFVMLQSINDSEKLLSSINSRGKAANSDHYWFTEKGVPSFFIYTMGKRKDYHDVNDMAVTLPLYSTNNLEQLLIRFTGRLMERTTVH